MSRARKALEERRPDGWKKKRGNATRDRWYAEQRTFRYARYVKSLASGSVPGCLS